MADIKVLDADTPGVSSCAQKEGLRSRWAWLGGTHVDSLVGEAGRDCRAFFFGVTQEDGEFLDCGHGNVSAIVASQEGLYMVSGGLSLDALAIDPA